MKDMPTHKMLNAAYAQIPKTKYTKKTRDAWEAILASLEHTSLATWSIVEESIAEFPQGKGWNEFSIFITDGNLEQVEVSSALFNETFVTNRHEFLQLYEEIKKNLSQEMQKENSYHEDKHGKYLLRIIGVLLIVAGGGWLYMNTNLLRTGEKVTGTIIENIQKSRGYAPKVQYIVQEKTFTTIATATQNPPQYNIGEDVTVYYDPQEPSHAVIASIFGMGFGPGMLLVAGIINLLLSAYKKPSLLIAKPE